MQYSTGNARTSRHHFMPNPYQLTIVIEGTIGKSICRFTTALLGWMVTVFYFVSDMMHAPFINIYAVLVEQIGILFIANRLVVH